MNDKNSLSHTTYRCKYHIVFIPKYRRKEIYGKLRSDMGMILRQLSDFIYLSGGHFSGRNSNENTTCAI